MSKYRLSVGDSYLIPKGREILPKFLESQELITGIATIVSLPDQDNQLVEMETHVNKDGDVQAIRFHITMEILNILERQGLLN